MGDLEKARRLNIAFIGLTGFIVSAVYLYILFAPQSFGNQTCQGSIRSTAIGVALWMSTEDKLRILKNNPERFRLSASPISNFFVMAAIGGGLDKHVARELGSGCALKPSTKAIVSWEESADAFGDYAKLAGIDQGAVSERIWHTFAKQQDEAKENTLSILKRSLLIIAFTFMIASLHRGAGKHLVPISISLLTGTFIVILLSFAFADSFFASLGARGIPVLLLFFQVPLVMFLFDIAFNRARGTTIMWNVGSVLLNREAKLKPLGD